MLLCRKFIYVEILNFVYLDKIKSGTRSSMMHIIVSLVLKNGIKYRIDNVILGILITLYIILRFISRQFH